MANPEDVKTSRVGDEAASDTKKRALTPEERIARYREQRKKERAGTKKENPVIAVLNEAVGTLIAIGVGVVVLLVVPLLLLRGCESLNEAGKENEGRALLCNDARERLDQVKKLRDNGFVSESAVRAMERQHDEACTW